MKHQRRPARTGERILTDFEGSRPPEQFARIVELLAAGYTEHTVCRRLAAEVGATPSEVAEAVSHAAECHRALWAAWFGALRWGAENEANAAAAGISALSARKPRTGALPRPGGARTGLPRAAKAHPGDSGRHRGAVAACGSGPRIRIERSA
jgi:hypothetical protein